MLTFQPTPAHPPALSPEQRRAVVSQLQSSQLFRDFQSAFETTTGLPLVLRASGSFNFPLHGSTRTNPFCADMAARNRTCAACLQFQQLVEDLATTEPKIMECFAGLAEAAVPIPACGGVIGHLQTGQVLLHAPADAALHRIRRQLTPRFPAEVLGKIRTDYFATRVITRTQLDSVVRLLAIFAQHLATLGSRILERHTSSQSLFATRARAYIAERYTEELTITEVARALNMSTFYFCKVFKRGTGLTFTDYVAHLRVECVKRRILDPHLRISEAAFAAGFQSLSQFNRVFRRIVGECPTAYRARLHETSAAGDHAA